jgi:hypothetical protein
VDNVVRRAKRVHLARQAETDSLERRGRKASSATRAIRVHLARKVHRARTESAMRRDRKVRREILGHQDLLARKVCQESEAKMPSQAHKAIPVHKAHPASTAKRGCLACRDQPERLVPTPSTAHVLSVRRKAAQWDLPHRRQRTLRVELVEPTLVGEENHRIRPLLHHPHH